MSEIEIKKEEPLTAVEARTIIEKIEKRDKELSERMRRTQEYINKISKISDKEVGEIKNKVEKANIGRLKQKHIAKIVDIMPKDTETVKALFTSEPITLKDEEIKKIIECLK
mgnify:FL=1